MRSNHSLSPPGIKGIDDDVAGRRRGGGDLATGQLGPVGGGEARVEHARSAPCQALRHLGRRHRADARAALDRPQRRRRRGGRERRHLVAHLRPDRVAQLAAGAHDPAEADDRQAERPPRRCPAAPRIRRRAPRPPRSARDRAAGASPEDGPSRRRRVRGRAGAVERPSRPAPPRTFSAPSPTGSRGAPPVRTRRAIRPARRCERPDIRPPGTSATPGGYVAGIGGRMPADAEGARTGVHGPSFEARYPVDPVGRWRVNAIFIAWSQWIGRRAARSVARSQAARLRRRARIAYAGTSHERETTR